MNTIYRAFTPTWKASSHFREKVTRCVLKKYIPRYPTVAFRWIWNSAETYPKEFAEGNPFSYDSTLATKRKPCWYQNAGSTIKPEETGFSNSIRTAKLLTVSLYSWECKTLTTMKCCKA